MRTDPSETGGLFVGRRPGTAPLRFRAAPQRGGDLCRRLDASVADTLLVVMVALSLLCWGPIPLACLWIGSEVDYLTRDVFLAIVVAFIALFPMLFGALVILRKLDGCWILMRRAAGHDQRDGAMARIFGLAAITCALAFTFWFLVIHGPGSQIAPGPGSS